MTDRGPNKAELDRLRSVLAAYGADPGRWPAGDRALAALLRDPQLTAIVTDARALDLALARASRPVAPAGAAERLLARTEPVPPGIVPFARPSLTGVRGRLTVLTALAASLALGLYLGASGQVDGLTPPLLAEESPEYLSAELDVLDGTLQLFADQIEP